MTGSGTETRVSFIDSHKLHNKTFLKEFERIEPIGSDLINHAIWGAGIINQNGDLRPVQKKASISPLGNRIYFNNAVAVRMSLHTHNLPSRGSTLENVSKGKKDAHEFTLDQIPTSNYINTGSCSCSPFVQYGILCIHTQLCLSLTESLKLTPTIVLQPPSQEKVLPGKSTKKGEYVLLPDYSPYVDQKNLKKSGYNPGYVSFFQVDNTTIRCAPNACGTFMNDICFPLGVMFHGELETEFKSLSLQAFPDLYQREHLERERNLAPDRLSMKMKIGSQLEERIRNVCMNVTRYIPLHPALPPTLWKRALKSHLINTTKSIEYHSFDSLQQLIILLSKDLANITSLNCSNCWRLVSKAEFRHHIDSEHRDEMILLNCADDLNTGPRILVNMLIYNILCVEELRLEQYNSEIVELNRSHASQLQAIMTQTEQERAQFMLSTSNNPDSINEYENEHPRDVQKSLRETMDKLASLTSAHDKLVSELNMNKLKLLCKNNSIQELTSSLLSLEQSSTQTSSTHLIQVQTLEQENTKLRKEKLSLETSRDNLSASSSKYNKLLSEKTTLNKELKSLRSKATAYRTTIQEHTNIVKNKDTIIKRQKLELNELKIQMDALKQTNTTSSYQHPTPNPNPSPTTSSMDQSDVSPYTLKELERFRVHKNKQIRILKTDLADARSALHNKTVDYENLQEEADIHANLDLPKIRELLAELKCEADPKLECDSDEALESDILFSQIQAFIGLFHKLGLENNNTKARLKDTEDKLDSLKHISNEWEKSFFEQDTISRKQADDLDNCTCQIAEINEKLRTCETNLPRANARCLELEHSHSAELANVKSLNDSIHQIINTHNSVNSGIRQLMTTHINQEPIHLAVRPVPSVLLNLKKDRLENLTARMTNQPGNSTTETTNTNQ